MLRPRLCDYCDTYTFVKETITVTNTVAQSAANNATTVCHLLTA